MHLAVSMLLQGWAADFISVLLHISLQENRCAWSPAPEPQSFSGALKMLVFGWNPLSPFTQCCTCITQKAVLNASIPCWVAIITRRAWLREGSAHRAVCSLWAHIPQETICGHWTRRASTAVESSQTGPCNTCLPCECTVVPWESNALLLILGENKVNIWQRTSYKHVNMCNEEQKDLPWFGQTTTSRWCLATAGLMKLNCWSKLFI